MNNNEIVEVIEKARAEMVQRGRTTGQLVDSDCKVCLLGAVGIAVFGGADELLKRTIKEGYELFCLGEVAPVVDELVKDLPRSFVAGICAIPPDDLSYADLYEFNDVYATTDDVLELFDRTVSRLKESA
ncbi:hypothetical protein SEA_BLUEFALCON_38 [Mycobacterium phage Bluefalcon]|uniref:Uncharacterized protein n=1 Tax=Mycobacterium phage Bluefalcon TaxID=2664224 RepID=A0A5Q2WFB6_9CAUD|nr:hypothetical protein KIP51_gp50 [Mycobacterium phage Bluefalcon]QGH75383.1 hypothetical protein SEA_BLUEFALCON_38 [Mycobacterium phage Bluefalcon]